eukprot:896332-Pelagomonas_calceolata.AAC.2
MREWNETYKSWPVTSNHESALCASCGSAAMNSKPKIPATLVLCCMDIDNPGRKTYILICAPRLVGYVCLCMTWMSRDMPDASLPLQSTPSEGWAGQSRVLSVQKRQVRHRSSVRPSTPHCTSRSGRGPDYAAQAHPVSCITQVLKQTETADKSEWCRSFTDV